MEAYLDNSATTPVFPEVVELMNKIMLEDFGNSSSLHTKGVVSEKYIRHAKEQIAKVLKVNEKEILFTSGGTESDNMALIGCAMANQRAGKHLITTVVEHPAVLRAMDYLEEQGFEITYLKVDQYGRISLEELKDSIRDDTILVSIMMINNEMGAIEPIAEAGALIKSVNPKTLFHVDAIQGFGKFKIQPKKMHIDLLAVSGHKIHGPKGVGFLYIGDKVKIKPLILGGGQQGGMRSGTENTPGCAGLGLATEIIYKDLEEDVNRLYELRDFFVEEVQKLGDITVNGHTGRETAPHIASVSVKGVRAEVLLHALEDRGIYVSSGSACSSNHPHTSGTLKSIGVAKDLLDSTVRFSFSIFTTKEEIEYTLQALSEIIPMLRKYARH